MILCVHQVVEKVIEHKTKVYFVDLCKVYIILCCNRSFGDTWCSPDSGEGHQNIK